MATFGFIGTGNMGGALARAARVPADQDPTVGRVLRADSAQAAALPAAAVQAAAVPPAGLAARAPRAAGSARAAAPHAAAVWGGTIKGECRIPHDFR